MQIGDPDQFATNLWQLEQQLTAANILYRTEGDGGRAGAIAALNAVSAFLHSIDRFRDSILAQPIVAIATALLDLNNGAQQPLVTPTRFGNRPPDSYSRLGLQAYAAATMEFLMRPGFTRQQAASAVAEELCKSGIKARGNQSEITWRTVANWRAALKNGKSQQFAVDTYRQVLALRLKTPTADDMAFRKAHLKSLRCVLEILRIQENP